MLKEMQIQTKMRCYYTNTIRTRIEKTEIPNIGVYAEKVEVPYTAGGSVNVPYTAGLENSCWSHSTKKLNNTPKVIELNIL